MCKKYIENNWSKHIKFINRPNQLEELVNVLCKYKHIDSLIKDYYNTLVFNLSNESLLSNYENSIEFISNTGILEEDKTHFRTNYMCFECFKNLTNIDVKNLDNRVSTIKLDKLEISNLNGNSIIVDTLDFNNGNDFKNMFIQDDIWKEEQPKNQDNIKYIYLFTKEINFFSNNTYYTFRGLFRLLKRVDNINYWKKCKISNDGKISIKEENIKSYIIDEESIN